MTNIELMKYWIESSDDDFETMKVLLKNEKYSWSLFIGHLVIEKLLKGLYAMKNEENAVAPKVHNLILLAQKCDLSLSDEQKEIIGVINTFNIGARYDDYKKEFQKKCTKEYTTEQIKNIEEMRLWLKEKLIQK